jgi:hypothetical protein
MQIWEEPLEGWQLKSMNFGLGCAEVDIGLQYGDFRFFKNVKTRERESRIERSMDMDPRSKSIHVREFEYYPRLVDWESIEREQIRVSADNARTIAENNGGRDKRLSVGNRCDIALLLSIDLSKTSSSTFKLTR